MLRKILKGEIGAADGDERRRLIDDHLVGKTGSLACERIVDVLAKMNPNMPTDKSISKQIQRWVLTRGLHLAKAVKSHLPGSHNRPEFQKHRFPGIAPDKIAKRIKRFQQLLGDTHKVRVEPISDVLVRIDP
jgi:hypothetical protein